MNFTYNGADVHGVTYNGAEVQSITMDGVEAWSTGSGSGPSREPSRIGLLWDGQGFYRVDSELNVIPNSEFDPENTFPFSEMTTDTVDGAEGVVWPVMYTQAEYVPSKGTYGRVWWIDSEPNENNHACPSFVADGEIQNGLWLKSTLESNTTYNDLCTKTKNTVMNFYDFALLQKLILIYYNTGTNPPQNSLAANAAFLNLQSAWGRDYQWIFGADMIKSGTNYATAGNGKLRILNPRMDGSFIDTNLSPSFRWVRGNFNIETVNGVNMGDLMFDTSTERRSNGSLTVSPFALQYFSSSCAFPSYSRYGFLGFSDFAPSASTTWRLRKCS